MTLHIISQTNQKGFKAKQYNAALLGSPCFTPELNSIGESNLELILISTCAPLYINLTHEIKYSENTYLFKTMINSIK